MGTSSEMSKGTGGSTPPVRTVGLTAVDSFQWPLGFRDRALGILGAGAVIGEHVDHDEVGDRGRRLLAGRADAGGRQRALGGLSEHRNVWVGGAEPARG